MSDDERAIRALQAEWFDATIKGDLPRVLSLMAEDVVFLTPGRPPFGRDVFAAGFTAGSQQAQMDASGDYEEVVVVGEVAYARARLSVAVTPKNAGSTKRFAGYTLTVFRKLPDGRWVLARDANLLAPAPE